MSHIDEGALHAYLDGALDEYPAAEARRVRDHLETCDDCVRRLAEERRVRDEAQGILGLAAPSVEVPTFEELRAYVKARTPERGRVSARLSRLSWAASVVLALGTGWLLRGGAPDSPAVRAFTPETAEEATPDRETTTIRAEAERAAPPGVEAPRAREASSSGSPQLLDASGGTDDFAGGGRSAAPMASAGAAPEYTREDAMDRLDAVTAPRGTAPSEPAAEVAAAPAPVAEAWKAADDRAPELAATVSLVGPEDASAAQRSAEPRLSSALRQAPSSGLGSGALTGPTSGSGPAGSGVGAVDADADIDPDAETVSLVVPGLEVLDVLPVGEGTTFAGMRALQRLPSGDTLETAHLPAGIDARALPPLPVGWSEVIRPRGSGWLILRAPLDETSLAELLQRLEGGR